MRIFVDADACPVVKIVEDTARTYRIPVTLLCDTNHILCSDYSEIKVIGAGADAVDYVLIGVGINCNQREFPEELAEKATSIWLETGQDVPRETLVCRVLEEFEHLYIQFCKEQSLAFIKDEYEAALVNRGETVCVLEPGHEWKGTALGISKTGALIVKTDGGNLREVDSGEVSVQGIYGE